MYRLRHIKTGRFFKNRGNGVMYSVWRINDGNIIEATTKGIGHIYATLTGVENLLKMINDKSEWEIVKV